MNKQFADMASKIIVILFIVIGLLISIFPLNAEAACSHSSLGTRYSDATHPHKYYRTCNS